MRVKPDHLLPKRRQHVDGIKGATQERERRDDHQGNDLELLQEIALFLENPRFHLPHQVKSRKSLVRLKALADVIVQLEAKANVVLREILNGKNGHV